MMLVNVVNYDRNTTGAGDNRDTIVNNYDVTTLKTSQIIIRLRVLSYYTDIDLYHFGET